MRGKYRNQFIILFLGAILFIPYLGAVHLFDWDEINFAEAAREMMVTHNYLQVQIDFTPFWEKPPLFFWLQVLSMHVFGVNEFAARFPNALCGIISLLVIFNTGKKIKDEKLGWLWVMCYAGSILPQLYFKSGIIDPVFNLFIFLGIIYFIDYLQTNNNGKLFPVTKLLISGLCIGVATLTKGPVAIIIIGLCFLVYFIWNKGRLFLPVKHIFYYIFFIVLGLLPWYGIEILTNGTWFIWQFTLYQFRLFSTQDAGHGGFFGYHFVVVFFGCFPASIFALRAFIKNEDTQVAMFRKWMIILFWVVIILFSIVQTKIIHYSSLTYFPLTFLAALTIYRIKLSWNGFITVGLIFTGIVFSAILILVPYAFEHTQLISSHIQDAFARASLQADGGWAAIDYLPGILMLTGLVFAILYNARKKAAQAVIILFSVSALCINSMIIIIVPHIEPYTQGALIDFIQEKSTEDCYIQVVGFKSYAPYFYGAKTAADNDSPAFEKFLDAQRTQYNHDATWPDVFTRKNQFGYWLLRQPLDKPLYVITKNTYADTLKKNYTMTEIGSKNGFVFFEKLPDTF